MLAFFFRFCQHLFVRISCSLAHLCNWINFPAALDPIFHSYLHSCVYLVRDDGGVCMTRIEKVIEQWAKSWKPSLIIDVNYFCVALRSWEFDEREAHTRDYSLCVSHAVMTLNGV